MTLAPGTAIDRYVVLERVGAGAMGEVYAAYDRKLDRRVALKLLLHRSEQYEARLVREAQAMARLSHPNVVAVFDTGELDGRLFLAMEFMRGATLRRWQRAPGRRWDEVLRAYVDAGRGLAAAHAAGLVHRDFKPDNVLIDDVGRVKVTDFGIARAVDEASAPTVAAAPSAPGGPRDPSSSGSLDGPMTEDGAMLGTPGYMPAEQIAGEGVDERSDQFSFCVALYEGLYGDKPFAGDGVFETTDSIVKGEIRPPPKGSPVPAFVRRALFRGLSAEREARYPTMQALLDELAHDPAQRGRRIAAAAAALAVVAVSAAAGARMTSASRAPPCAGGDAEAAEVWNPEVARRIDDAMTATGAPYARDSWLRTRDQIDRYVRDWAASYRQTCEATRVAQTQSEAVMTVRMACLEQRRDEVRALVGVLAGANRDVAGKSLSASTDLTSLDRCRDITSLTAIDPEPRDPAATAKIAAVRKQVADAHALQLAGKYADGLAVATPAVEEARSLRYLPLVAQALDARGELLVASGKPADAEPLFVEAYADAYESRDDARAAQTASHLVLAVGVWLDRSAAGRQWALLGGAAASHIRANDDLRAELLAQESALEVFARTNGPKAVALAKEALALRERVSGPDGYLTAVAYLRLGSAHYVDHDMPAARAAEEKGLAILMELVGGNHPAIAGALSNLATTYADDKDYAHAASLTERALAIHEATVGAGHPAVAIDLINLGDALAHLDRCGEALERYRRAVAINDAVFSPSYVRTTDALAGIAECLRRTQRPREARPILDRALAICEDHEEPHCVAVQRFVLAKVTWDLGDHAAATALARQAESSGAGGDPDWLAEVKAWLAGPR